jgi:uncharacterized membrane protein YeaQ/YmgE (transglycosylase-associated protein family)
MREQRNNYEHHRVDRSRLDRGVIAKALMPGNEPGEIIVTVLLGIAGAFVARFVATGLGISDGVNSFDLGTIVLGVGGALALLIVYRSIFGARVRG